MKRLLLAGVVSVSLVLPASAALAGGYYRGHSGHYYGGHHYGGHHYGGHHNGDGLLIAAGIIGGAFLLGSLLSQPRYYQPPAYYPPQPAYVPSCYQEEVWRRLPDGRMQTGIRTRCY